ncbi:hypothetical protein QF007_001752 [Clavibacter michiganensis]|nr:hypothetical protein [Clavibacter michiganensis]
MHQQRVEDRERLGRVVDPDVHVHAPDHHLPPPPPGAVEQRRVALVVRRDVLVGPRAEGVGAGAHEVDAERIRDVHHPLDEPRQVVHGVSDAGVRRADDLDRVREELPGHVRVRVVVGEGAEDRRRDAGELARAAVDARELPLDPDAGRGPVGEVDLHAGPAVHGVSGRMRRVSSDHATHPGGRPGDDAARRADGRGPGRARRLP